MRLLLFAKGWNSQDGCLDIEKTARDLRMASLISIVSLFLTSDDNRVL